MKKIIALILALLPITALFCGCNEQIFDTTYEFDRAIIMLPNGRVIDGKVQSWKDYEDSDAVQVKINGVTYYTFLSNVVLIDE